MQYYLTSDHLDTSKVKGEVEAAVNCLVAIITFNIRYVDTTLGRLIVYAMKVLIT